MVFVLSAGGIGPVPAVIVLVEAVRAVAASRVQRELLAVRLRRLAVLKMCVTAAALVRVSVLGSVMVRVGLWINLGAVV